MRWKARAVSALTVVSLVALTLVSTINEQDFYAYHDVRPNDRCVRVEPGAFYEVNETAECVCRYADADIEVTEPPFVRRYYNILGNAVPVLARAYAFAIPDDTSATALVELEYRYYEETLALKPHKSEEDCYDRVRVASERGSLICVVDTVYYSAASGALFAVKFKEFTFAPRGNEYPRCKLAGHPLGLASLKRILITFSELPTLIEDLSDEDNGAVTNA